MINDQANDRVRSNLSDLDEAIKLFRERVASEQTIPLHTEEQLRAKKEAIRFAAKDFADHMNRGTINDELLYHYIENLNSLVVELKRG